MNMKYAQSGFTLIEIAIVLVIVGLLIGGLLTPLATQKEQERRKENQKVLEEAREALIGYAAANGYLPCPDITGDGLEDRNPVGPACGDSASNNMAYPNGGGFGYLPWATLGIKADLDPWGAGHFYKYSVNGTYVKTFDLNAVTNAAAGGATVDVYSTAAACGTNNNLVAQNVPAVIRTTAKTDYTLPPTPSADENENDDNDRCYVDRVYSTAAGNQFDDQLIWLSSAVLFNRLISAGVLP